MPFDVSPPRTVSFWPGRRISQLTGRPSPLVPDAAEPWAISPTRSSQSSGLSIPGAILADEAAFLTGQHYLVFDDPWLPSFPKLLSQRRHSELVSPKTNLHKGQVCVLAPPTDGRAHSRSGSCETVKPTDIHGRPMSRITLSKALTADVRSFLLMRRWVAIRLVEADKQQAGLDTCNCDMIDEIMDLETRYRAMLDDQGKDTDMSPRDFYNKQREVREVFEKLAKVRKQRVQVLAEKKRLDEQNEKASKYLEGELAKLLDQLDITFEKETLIPTTGSVAPTPLTGSSQEVPIMLGTSDNEYYDTTEEDHDCTCSHFRVDSLSADEYGGGPSSQDGADDKLAEKIIAWRDRAILKCPEAAEEMQHRAAKLAVSQMDEALKQTLRSNGWGCV